MAKRSGQLFSYFHPEKYELHLHTQDKSQSSTGHVKIEGIKVGRPSKKLTFYQKGLKIQAAKITAPSKKGDREYRISRINHIKSFEEVRLHTEELLYPGPYRVEIYFNTSSETDRMPKLQISRKSFPCIDEPEAKTVASLKIKE